MAAKGEEATMVGVGGCQTRNSKSYCLLVWYASQSRRWMHKDSVDWSSGGRRLSISVGGPERDQKTAS